MLPRSTKSEDFKGPGTGWAALSGAETGRRAEVTSHVASTPPCAALLLSLLPDEWNQAGVRKKLMVFQAAGFNKTA